MKILDWFRINLHHIKKKPEQRNNSNFFILMRYVICVTSSLCEHTWLSLISSVSNCQKDGDLCRPLALAMGWLFTCQPLYGLMNQIYIIRSHLENLYLCVWLLAYIEFKKCHISHEKTIVSWWELVSLKIPSLVKSDTLALNSTMSTIRICARYVSLV